MIEIHSINTKALKQLLQTLQSDLAKQNISEQVQISPIQNNQSDVLHRGAELGAWAQILIAAVGSGGFLVALASVFEKIIESRKGEIVIKDGDKSIELRGNMQEIKATLEQYLNK